MCSKHGNFSCRPLRKGSRAACSCDTSRNLAHVSTGVHIRGACCHVQLCGMPCASGAALSHAQGCTLLTRSWCACPAVLEVVSTARPAVREPCSGRGTVAQQRHLAMPSTCVRCSTGRASTTMAVWQHGAEVSSTTAPTCQHAACTATLLLLMCTLHAGNCGAVGCTHAGSRLPTALGPG